MKKFVKTFRVDNKGNKRLEALMEKLDMNLSDTINKLIADGIQKTISGEKLEEEPIRKRKKEKEIKCPSRVYLEGIGYHCAEKPARPKKLGDGSIEHSNTLCKAHKEMIELLEKHEIYKHFIEESTVKVHYCAHPDKSFDNPLVDPYNHRFDGQCMDKGRIIWCPKEGSNFKAEYCTSYPISSKCEYIRYLEIDKKEFNSKIEWIKERLKK